jgi:glycosyltransferase involved in cell wall biosynthesis
MPKKKQVVFVAASTHGGGAERMLINIMHSLSHEKYEIYFINTSKEHKPESLNSSIKYIQYNKRYAKNSYFELSRDLLRINPNYIFTSSIVIAYLLQLIRFFLNLKSKLIVRISVSPSDLPNFGFKTSLLKIVNLLILRHVDLIIAQTEFSKLDIAKEYKISLRKIKVIRNIIDKNLLEKLGNKYYPSQYIQDTFNIIASGALYSVKGFDLLIEAMEVVVKCHPQVKLYILGCERYEKGYKDQLLLQIERNKLTNNIYLLGYLSNPYPYYKNADLFVLSSRKESFPNVVLEALYYNTPVVVTNCVDFSEVVHNGINGYIVNKNSVIGLSDGIIDAINLLKNEIKNDLGNFDYELIFN